MTETSRTEAHGAQDTAAAPNPLVPHVQPPSAQAADKPSTPTPIELLPNELLSNIFGFLESPNPSSSESALHDEPHFDLTKSDNAPLIAACCVSKRWRRATIPLLFKHAQLVIKEDGKKREPPIINEIAKLFLDFVSENQLNKAIQTFTLIAHNETITPPAEPNELSDQLQAIQISDFWHSLFNTIDPKELIIVAPPDVLGVLASCQIYIKDMWNFDCPCHYLRLQMRPEALVQSTHKGITPPAKHSARLGKLSIVEPLLEASARVDAAQDLAQEPNIRSDRSHAKSQDHKPEASSSAAPTKDPTTIWNVRPWANLLLNEGSFMRAFATYEFWNREAPSILPDLIGADERTSRISPTIRSLSYISMFPLQSHFAKLTSHFPRLDRLYVQIVPRNEIMQNAKKMQNIEAEDLWMERNSCYALLMRELFNAPPVGNYKHLVEFESGDAADKDAWDMAVEFVKRSGNGWKVKSEGVFMREKKDVVEEEGDCSAFQGALMLWAFNGTAKLPVSPYPFYNGGMGN